jgi:SAM-dependent methyltransferase
VLHLGATDSPFTRDKARAGDLLHQKLRGVAADLVGVDLDAEAVAWLRQALGIEDILVGDALDPKLLAGRRFDLVLCCDVIEHVSNPGALLEATRKALADGGSLALTTVNAMSIKVALRALLGREAVHPDHTCYYSYATLCELMWRHRLTPLRFGTFVYPTVHAVTGWFLDRLAARAPASADGLFFVAERRLD